MKKRHYFLKLVLVLVIAFIGVHVYQKYESEQNSQSVRKATKTVIANLLGDVSFPEIQIQEESLQDKFYYQSLPEDERTYYKEVLQGLSERSEEIRIHCGDTKVIQEMYQYVLYDYPELFWCEGQGKITTHEKMLGSVKQYGVLEPVYNCSKTEMEEKKSQIESATERFFKSLSSDLSDYEKVKAVYDYVIEKTVYEQGVKDNQNISSVFVNEKSVCAGYAKATQYLLEKLSVPCYYVVGKAKDEAGREQDHAWNLVKCDGDYYYLDTTWGDAGFLSAEGVDTKEEYICYDYLLCTEKELAVTHTWDEKIGFPECVATKDNYYRKTKNYYKEADGDALLKAMNRDISNQKGESVFKFKDAKTYKKGRKLIMDSLVEQAAQNLMKWYGLSSVSYYYSESKENHRITLFWNYG